MSSLSYKKNGMQFDPQPLKGKELDTLRSLCPIGEYRVIQGGEISYLTPIVSQGLLRTCNSAVISGSPAANGLNFYLVNLNRIDASASAIDQNPYGLAFNDVNTSASGILVQHGKYEHRSTYPPVDIWPYFKKHGITAAYPLQELPSQQKGKLYDLGHQSHFDAMGLIVKELLEMMKKDDRFKDYFR